MAGPAAAEPVIRIRDLTRVYTMGETEVRALDGVSIDVAPGEFLAVMGPSGSGKSTFMNIVGCLDRPTSGSYVLEGVDVSTLDRNERASIRNDKIGFVFQSFNLLSRTSALENVELPLLYSRKHRLSDAGQLEKARACLAKVGLAERWDHTPAQLSGGQQQRVAVARALVNDPAILLADEPTGNLDSRTGESILELLRDIHTETGATMLMATHSDRAASYAGRTLTIADGVLAQGEAVA